MRHSVSLSKNTVSGGTIMWSILDFLIVVTNDICQIVILLIACIEV